MTLLIGTAQIESDRLILRRIDQSDLDYFIAIHADEDVARYIGAGNPRPKAETEQWFSDIQASYENSDLGQLMVLRKSDGMRVGRCGLSDAALERNATEGVIRKGWFFSSQAPHGTELEYLPELGYTFGKENWGQGYASEAAGCVYKYARSALNFPKIMSVIHTDNKASLGVAQKFGVQFVDSVELAGRAFDRYHWPMDSIQIT